MSATAITELDLHPSVQAASELVRAAESAAEFLDELAPRTFPQFDGKLRLQVKVDAPRKHEQEGNLWMALTLIDDVGGFGSIAGVREREFADQFARENALRELWMSALWERSNVLERRVGQFDVEDGEEDRG